MTTHDSSPQAPSVKVSTARRISPIWIVPTLVAFAVGYMLYDGWKHRGPMITITFHDAEGVVAGKSPLKFEGVVVGKVEEIRADVASGKVTIKARLDASARDLAVAGSQFWIQQPEIGVGGVSSLDTLISGPYIACLPGDGAPIVEFDGLPVRPPTPASRPGLRATLRADAVGALRAGSPVLYRGVEVGAVDAVTIADNGEHVAVEVFIEERAAPFVRQNTVFWEVSGLDIDVDLDRGLIVDTDALRNMLEGAVAFHTDDVAMQTTVAQNGSTFTLHQSPVVDPSRALYHIAGQDGQLRQIVDRLAAILNDLDSAESLERLTTLSDRAIQALDSVDQILRPDGDLAQTIDSLHQMSSRLDRVLAQLEADDTLAQADQLVTTLEKSAPEIVDAFAGLNETLAGVDAIVQANDQSITDAIRALRDAALELEALLEDIRANPSQLLSKPPAHTTPRSRQ